MTTNEMVILWGALSCSAIWASAKNRSALTDMVSLGFFFIVIVQVIVAVVR